MLKNTEQIKRYCTGFTLITSESCNLACSYCDMAQHINKKCHSEEAKKVKEALINGQFLNTIKTTINRFGLDPLQIKHLDLWGQEPTLTLDEFNFMFPQLYEYCSNIEYLFFSTNGVANVDKILNLVCVLKDTITKQFKLKVQFSYDGKIPTKKHRGANPDTIINNITTFITEVNKMDLGENLTVDITFHNVADNEIMEYFADPSKEEELFEYENEFDELTRFFFSLKRNPSVTITPFSVGIIKPFNGSVQDGKNLTAFYQNCENLLNKYHFDHLNWKGLTIQVFAPTLLADYDTARKFFLHEIPKGHPNPERLAHLSDNLDCGFNRGVIKIRYDGQLLPCQAAIFGLTEEALEGREDSAAMIQRTRVQKKFYPNIITDSDEVIDKYLYQVNTHAEASFLQCMSQVASLMTCLLHAGQIDPKYADPDEFFKAAFHMALSTNCAWDAMMYTGTLYGKYAGWIRFLCNGFLDYVYKEKEIYINYQNEKKELVNGTC